MVDDDAELCQMVIEYLAPEGFDVEAIHSGPRGLEKAATGNYSLILLDVMLPLMNGLDVLRQLRQISAVRVLLLTARGEPVDRIVGLEIGADDYLPKPFDPRELLARIRAVLRRPAGDGAQPLAAPPEKISVGDVELDRSTRTVKKKGHPLDLTAVEFELLDVLLRSAGRVVTRELLVKSVLERNFSPFDRSIDMHVSNLRKKLGDHRIRQERIKTIRSVGYLYAGESQPPSGGI